MPEVVGYTQMSGFSPERKVPIWCWYPTSDLGPQLLWTRWVRYPAVPGGAFKAGPYRVVIFSHGWWECPHSHLFLIWKWASEGAIVLAPQHIDTGNCDGLKGLGDFGVYNLNQALSLTYGTSRKYDIQACVELAHARWGNDITLLIAGHSTGGWTAAYQVDHRISGTLLLSPSSAAAQPASEYASARPPTVIVYADGDTAIGTAQETMIFDEIDGPAYQTVVTGTATHYDFADRQRCTGDTDMDACIASDSRTQQVADAAMNWFKAVALGDATAQAALDAYPRVK